MPILDDIYCNKFYNINFESGKDDEDSIPPYNCLLILNNFMHFYFFFDILFLVCITIQINFDLSLSLITYCFILNLPSNVVSINTLFINYLRKNIFIVIRYFY